MKMKKLLSISALALVLASSVSIGASAAERPSNEQIKKDLASMFLNNKNPLNYNINSKTISNRVLDKETLTTDADEYGFSYLDSALAIIDPNKTVIDNAEAIFAQIDADKLLKDLRKVAVQLRTIDNSNGADKFKMEKDLKTLLAKRDGTIDVKFGRNKDGNITMTITKVNKVILQLNSQNAYTISDALGNNSDQLSKYAELLKLL